MDYARELERVLGVPVEHEGDIYVVSVEADKKVVRIELDGIIAELRKDPLKYYIDEARRAAYEQGCGSVFGSGTEIRGKVGDAATVRGDEVLRAFQDEP